MWFLICFIIVLICFLLILMWLLNGESQCSDRLSKLFQMEYKSNMELQLTNRKAIDTLEEVNNAYKKVLKENGELKRKLEKYVDKTM